MLQSEEELKSLLMSMKEESEKAGLKATIQKSKFMAFSIITSWQIEGENFGNNDRFFWGGPPKSLWMVTVAMKLTDACFLEGKL